MEEKGSKGVTARMCNDKFKNLKTRYKAIIPVEKTLGQKEQASGCFFYAIDDILRRDVAVNPTNIIDASGYNAIKRRWVCSC